MNEYVITVTPTRHPLLKVTISVDADSTAEALESALRTARAFQPQGGTEFLVAQAEAAGIDPDAAREVLADEQCLTRTGRLTGQAICTRCAPDCEHYLCTNEDALNDALGEDSTPFMPKLRRTLDAQWPGDDYPEEKTRKDLA